MTARRALSADEGNVTFYKTICARRVCDGIIADGTTDFVRPRRVALPSIEDDAIVPFARCVSAETTMNLPVIDVDAVHTAVVSKLKSRRRVSLPAAAVAITSAIGLGAALIPQAVAADPDHETTVAHEVVDHDATDVVSVTRDANRPSLNQTSLEILPGVSADVTEVAATKPVVPDDSAQDLNDSFATLGKDTAQKLADKEAADKEAAEKAAAEKAAANAAANATTGTRGGGGSRGVVLNAAPADSAVAQTAINFALNQVGKPYGWGAVGPSAFDCSGLMVAAYSSAGISLPRVTYGQMTVGTPVSASALAPGDLVFFYGGEHVGMYLGNGQVVHAADYGTGVIIASLSTMPMSSAVRVA